MITDRASPLPACPPCPVHHLYITLRSKWGEPTYLFANILDTDAQAFVAVTLNKRECESYQPRQSDWQNPGIVHKTPLGFWSTQGCISPARQLSQMP